MRESSRSSRRELSRGCRRAALAIVAVAVASCANEYDPTGPEAALSVGGGGSGNVGDLVLCKYTESPTAATFDFHVSSVGGQVPGNGDFTLSAIQDINVGPDCAVVWTPTSDEAATVTIEEATQPGWELFAVYYDAIGFIEPLQNPVSLTVNPSVGGSVFFKNRPVEIDMAPGRMTGGGGQIRVDGVRITRGFTIHCDITLSNNIEINWSGHRWHLDKPLTSAICIDDPLIEPAPPAAPFDTFIGEGVGRLNNVDGSFLRFTFIDAGEPGGSDRAAIQIWAPGADPAVDAPVLTVSGLLDNGNLQAHYDQPHK
jgi:hypothetical protein